MAEFMNTYAEPTPSGFAAMGKPVSYQRRSKALDHCKSMGLDAGTAWCAIQEVAGALEREIVKQLRPIFPDAQRQLEYQQGFGVDLMNTGSLRIQCKRGRNYAPITKIEEVPKAKDRIPVLVTRADQKQSVACLYLKDLIAILEDVATIRRDV